MTTINFYSSNFPEYFWQKGHYNLGNSVIHSDLYKKLNPIRARYDYTPNDYTQMPFFLGVVPQFYWLYGNLDYSFHKYHRHYQAHDDWYPDRKNKTLGHKNGSQCQPNMKNSKYMTLIPNFIPRGCYKEIRKYQICAAKDGADSCFQDKISIMEVCPDHVLDALREKKKWYLRAEMIDNDTYKRAMTVSDFNKGRSVSELKLKTWAHGKNGNLRSDSFWQDDRYDPTKYAHNHRYDNVNFPEQEFKDFFGGTIGTAESEEYEKNRIGLFGAPSKAMSEQASATRMAKLRGAVDEVKKLNEHDKKH
jgi:hypothetical protein